MKRPVLRVALALVVAAMIVSGPVTISGGARGTLQRSPPLEGLVTTDGSTSPLNVTLSVGPLTTEAGFPVNAYCTVSGGVPPYFIKMDFGVPGSNFTDFNQNPPYQPVSTGGSALYQNGGTYTISCTATDAASTTTSAAETVHIIPRPSVVLRGSSSSLLLGQNVTLAASVQGGTGPFTFLWMNLPPGCSYGNVSAIDCTPTSSGTWTVTVTVLDSYGVFQVSRYTVSVATRALILGMPQGEATVVLGVIALAAAAFLALTGFLLVRRGRRKAPAAPSPPEPESRPAGSAGLAKGAEAPGPLTAHWKALAPPVRRSVLLAALAALSAGLYLGVTWFASYIPELTPPGLSLLLVFLAVLVSVASFKLMGPLLSVAGLLGGVALYYALSQPISTCTDNTAMAQALGVPTCGGLFTEAVTAGIVVGVVAVGAGVLLFRWSRTTLSEKPFLAVGVLVLAILVASSTIVLTTPPPVPSGAGPEVLPFPIPAGSAFVIPFQYYDSATDFTFYISGPQAFARVSANGFEPAVLVGGWNSSVPVCLYVGNVNWGPVLPPPYASYGDCGTSVTFHYPLKPAAWTIQFWLQNATDESATITITQTVQVVY